MDAMKPTATLISTLLFAAAAAVAGCKKATVSAPPGATPAPVTEMAAPAEAPTAAPAATAKFDLNSVAVTTAALPPFPYLDYPDTLPKDDRTSQDADFDRVYMVAGTELRPVEGRVSMRHYSMSMAKMSAIAVQRNYENALKAMGAVAVSKMQPNEAAFTKLHPEVADTYESKKNFKVLDWGNYTSYLLRTATTNIWIAFCIDSNNVTVVAVEEKAMVQAIKPLTAALMQSELDKVGHVALYLNFDTDKALIRAADQGTLEQVSTLLATNGGLKLNIEGHTDSSGDASHNQLLSAQRAGAVLASLVGGGVDRMRLRSAGFGGSRPLADNASEAGRAKNRRVELVKQG